MVATARGNGRLAKVMAWSIAVVAGLAALLTTLTFTFFWRSPGYYLDVEPHPGERLVVSKRGYRLGHPQPYVYRTGDVVVYGSVHTRDPADPQLADIERRWREFKPTVALLEGRLGFLFPGLMDPVEQYGEMGWTNALAKADDVTTYSWELPWDEAATRLAEVHPPERVALYFVLRPYFSSLRFGRPASPEAQVEEYLHRASIPALAGTVESVADIDRLWRRDFPGERDWRDVSDQGPLVGYLNDIAADSEDLRNRHLVQVIHTLLARGERVFVVCGASHAVLIEPALTGSGSSRSRSGSGRRGRRSPDSRGSRSRRCGCGAGSSPRSASCRSGRC